MGPASLQEEREPEKGPKEEMESYRYLLQAGSQLEDTLQREYTRCRQSSFHLWEPLQAFSITQYLLSNCLPSLVFLSAVQQTETEMHRSRSLTDSSSVTSESQNRRDLKTSTPCLS